MKNLIPADYNELKNYLAPRLTDAHKGNFGHVLVIGGDYGYAGAPVLSALGALYAGAGLVTVASHNKNLLGLSAVHPEIMTCDIDSPEAIREIFAKATVVVLGPGLGRSSWSKEVYLASINTSLPMVLDADGLYWLAQIPQQRTKLILTPHPGEAAVLLNTSKVCQGTQRLTTIQKLITMHNATVVLKGSGTLVGSPDQAIKICTSGNPGMASGGMGDLLSGVIAGLVAQSLQMDVAAKLGVCVHAMAGDIIANTQGQRGMLATDLLQEIRKLLN